MSKIDFIVKHLEKHITSRQEALDMHIRHKHWTEKAIEDAKFEIHALNAGLDIIVKSEKDKCNDKNS